MMTFLKALQKPIMRDDDLPFFSEDTTEQLLAANAMKSESKRKPEQILTQPSDYAEASGLFDHDADNKETEKA